MDYWHLHPDVLLWIGLIEGAYLYGLRAVGRSRGLQATRAQIAWFTGGVAVLLAGAGTPIHDLAEQRLFSVHMVQHMLFTLVAPPMMLLGIPGWLLRPLLRNRVALRVARTFTRALPAFALFNVTTLITHLPFAVDASLHHHTLHFLVHIVLLVTATLMWWAVLSPLPELPRLTPLFQIGYLFVQSFVPTVLASFITFAHRPLYDFYAAAPRTWGMSARTDQLVAGLIMKIGGGVILWTVMGIVFFTWFSREEKASAPAQLRWEEVEEELDRMGLTPRGAAPRES